MKTIQYIYKIRNQKKHASFWKTAVVPKNDIFNPLGVHYPFSGFPSLKINGKVSGIPQLNYFKPWMIKRNLIEFVDYNVWFHSGCQVSGCQVVPLFKTLFQGPTPFVNQSKNCVPLFEARGGDETIHCIRNS